SSIVKRTSKILGIDRYSDFNDYYYRYNNRNHYDIDNLENQIAEEICEYFKKTNKEWISKKDLIKSIFTDKDNNNLVTIASEKLKDYSDKATRMEFKENISYLISKDIIESRTFRDLIEKESGYKIQGQLHNEKYYIYNAKEF